MVGNSRGQRPTPPSILVLIFGPRFNDLSLTAVPGGYPGVECVDRFSTLCQYDDSGGNYYRRHAVFFCVVVVLFVHVRCGVVMHSAIELTNYLSIQIISVYFFSFDCYFHIYISLHIYSYLRTYRAIIPSTFVHSFMTCTMWMRLVSWLRPGKPSD
mgnify:CR=1 FL=1